MILDTFINNIKKTVNSTEIKYARYAREQETLESTRNSDIYIGARTETDTFAFYPKFDKEAIEKAGLKPPLYDSNKLAEDKTLIPEAKRRDVLREQRKIIIRDYKETNNYYRAINGLPDIEETEKDFIKIPQDLMDKFLINPKTIYVHTVSINAIYSLEAIGYIDELIKEYPTKKYLKFLGHNKVDILSARQSTNFGILRITKDIPEEDYISFLKIYDQCREYHTTVIYNQDYGNSYTWYDEFMGFSIMTMTIQRMMSNTFKFGIQRDFYDWDFLQSLYKMYNIPFIENLGLEYHMIISRNLNNLLRYKATDKVLFDICSLLGYEHLKIFKYYLMKRHKMKDGVPVFKYNEVDDGMGGTVMVEDRKNMYDLYFQSVNLKEQNVTLSLLEDDNKLEYFEVTNNDPYWVEDAELDKIKYDEVFNYVETKYISIHLMYKMTVMLFEVTYVFRMIIDKKDELNSFILKLPKINETRDFKIFDVVIFLICLLCKKNGFKDYTITTPSKISHIYGFNFNKDVISKIKKMISDNADLIDQDTANYFNNLKINSAEDVNKLFEQIREYNDFIIDKMATSQNIKEYQLYKDIFTISLMTETQTQMFTIKDSEGNDVVATSYLEYLYHSDYVLAEYIDNLEIADMSDTLDHIISAISAAVDNLKYLYILNDMDSPILKSIISLINFFKSYTVDLASYNIVYVFDSKYYNMIKFIEDIKAIEVTLDGDDSMEFLYGDRIEAYNVLIDKMKSNMDIRDRYESLVSISFNEELVLKDKIQHLYKTSRIEENLILKDKIHHSIKTGEMVDVLKIFDEYGIYSKLQQQDILPLQDIIHGIFNVLGEKDMLYLKDTIYSILTYYNVTELLGLLETISMCKNIGINDDGSISDTGYIYGQINKSFSLDAMDILFKLLTTINTTDSLKMKEWFDYIPTINLSSTNTMTDICTLLYIIRMKDIILYRDIVKTIEGSIQFNELIGLVETLSIDTNIDLVDDGSIYDIALIETHINKSISLDIIDILSRLSTNINTIENLDMREWFNYTSTINLMSTNRMNDNCVLLYVLFMKDKLKYTDSIKSVEENIDFNMDMIFNDAIKSLSYNINLKESEVIHDTISLLEKIIIFIDTTVSRDDVQSMSKEQLIKIFLSLKEYVSIIVSSSTDDNIVLSDDINEFVEIFHSDTMNGHYFDHLSLHALYKRQNKLILKDSIKLLYD